ncbi:MAG TPA: organic hydroperoxide resistance protein [Solirubrobacteraceae bacterium]|nr:organic hydroperoxide resistance protein [Solirubrobacteraceae bacterium]
MADPLYTAQATAYHGRDGAVKSSDGILDLEVHPPTELGGPGSGTNPEQLFAAGYAACFGSSLLFFAARREIDISDSTVTARVGLGPDDAGGMGISVELHVDLPGVDEATARKLIRSADKGCPYSRATRGNIPHELFLGDEKLEEVAA